MIYKKNGHDKSEFIKIPNVQMRGAKIPYNDLKCQIKRSFTWDVEEINKLQNKYLMNAILHQLVSPYDSIKRPSKRARIFFRILS